MSKRVRLLIVVVVVLGVFGVPTALRVMGDRQVEREARRIRTATAAARVDTSRMLASMFDAHAVNPVAVALDTKDSDVTVRQHSPGWCARIAVRRLTAQRDVFVLVDAEGRLVPVERCSDAA